MNLDSINDENVPFNRAISDTMIILANYLKDPFANVNNFLKNKKIKLNQNFSLN